MKFPLLLLIVLASCLSPNSLESPLPKPRFEGHRWVALEKWLNETTGISYQAMVTQDPLGEYWCHGCAPQLAILKKSAQNAEWELAMNLGAMGSWGEPFAMAFKSYGEKSFVQIHASYFSGGTNDQFAMWYDLDAKANLTEVNSPVLTLGVTTADEYGIQNEQVPASAMQTIEDAHCPEMPDDQLGHYYASWEVEFDEEKGQIHCQITNRICGIEPPCPIPGIKENGIEWSLPNLSRQTFNLPLRGEVIRDSTSHLACRELE